MSGRQPRRKGARQPAPRRSVASRDAPKPRASKGRSRRAARHIGRNSGGTAVSPERRVRAERPPPPRRLTGRMAGEAPWPSRRLGTVTPIDRSVAAEPAADRCWIRFELVVPDMARQLLAQADRIGTPGPDLLAGWAAAAAAADLIYWRVRRCGPDRAGTVDSSALDDMFDPREIERIASARLRESRQQRAAHQGATDA